MHEVERIAVLGAGTMGHGIAEVAALAGFAVTVRDVEDQLVQEGYERIEWSLEQLVEDGELAAGDAEDALDHIDPVVDVAAAVGDADVVIEAVPERMDTKRSVLGAVEEHAPERTVVATNTSSLSVTALSGATERADRFCGMHFFNPPVRMDLVEVVRGEDTAEETLALVDAVAADMGKTPLRVHEDRPGFVVNRVLLPLLNEAAWTVETTDTAATDVDSAAKHGLGLPMGALELADRIGLDVVLDVLEYMEERLGDAYAPCPLFERSVAADELGRKTGAGVYDYGDGGAEIPPGGDEGVARRLVAVAANEVAKLVEEGVAGVGTVDTAMELGAGFPAGPTEMADDVGLETLYTLLRERHGATDASRYEPTGLLGAYATRGDAFHDDTGWRAPEFETIRVDRVAAVGRITLDRPRRMNTITPAMLEELRAAREHLLADDDVAVILLTGAGDRAFSAGAAVEEIADSDGTEAYELALAGQQVFGGFESCALPVIAAVDGYCLGGGMELAAACDLRVAAASATFGQPECTLGLVPGWGGTQRLPRIVGQARATEMILTGDRYDAETVAADGFLTRVHGEEDLDAAAVEFAAELADGAPLARRFAKRAIHARHDGESGFAVEAAAFGLLAATEDATEGIAAFREGRDPEFKGK